MATRTTDEQLKSHLVTAIEARCAQGGGVTKDALIDIKTFSDLETRLGGAPIVLGILGNLAAIAAKSADFSLDIKDPTKTSLKIPESFRASLAQAGNMVYEALSTAHGNMSFIDASVVQIPGQLQDISNLLLNGSNRDIQDHLPMRLVEMKRVSDRCEDKIMKVVEEFDAVIKLLGDLELALLNKRGLSEQEKQDIAHKVEARKREEQFLLDNIKEAEEQLKKSKEDMEKAEESFKAELEATSSMKMVGMQMAHSFIEALPALTATLPLCVGKASLAKDLLAGVAVVGNINVANSKDNSGEDGANLISTGISILKKVIPGSDGKAKKKAESDDAQKAAEQPSYDPEVVKVADKLYSLAIKPFKLDSAENGSTSQEAHASEAKNYLHEAETHLTKLQASKTKSDLEKLCLKLSYFLGKLERSQGEQAPEDGLIKDWEGIRKECEQLRSKKLEGSCIPGPNQVLEARKAVEGVGQVSEDVQKSMFLALEMKKLHYDQKRELATKLREEERQRHEEMFRVLQKLTSLQQEELNQKQILEVIGEALSKLNDLRDQWQNLALFFRDINNLIVTTMGPNINMFILAVEKESQKEQLGRLTAVVKDMIYKNATKAVVTAKVVGFLSSSYVSLSKSHLMPMINKFHELLAISMRDTTAIKQQRLNLDKQVEEAGAAIGAIVEEGHRQFLRDVHDRQREIQETFEAYPALQDVSDRIKDEAKQIAHKNAEEMGLNFA